MLYQTALTSKGQATIPQDIRLLLGLLPQHPVTFQVKSKQVILKPATNFLSLAGSIKSKKTYSDKKADKSIQKMFSKKP